MNKSLFYLMVLLTMLNAFLITIIGLCAAIGVLGEKPIPFSGIGIMVFGLANFLLLFLFLSSRSKELKESSLVTPTIEL